MAKNKDYVSIPRDEYEELVECKTKLNLLIDYAIEKQKASCLSTGCHAVAYDAYLVNNILGCSYIGSYIDGYKKKYKEMKARKE